MSNRAATVIAEDGLNLRAEPNTASAIIAVLGKGQQVTITAALELWRRVETPFGPGFVHADYITVDGHSPVSRDPPGLDTAISSDDLKPADNRTGLTATAAVAYYSVLPGDTLSALGAKLGLSWRALALVNGLTEPFNLNVNQVLRLPAGASIPPQAGYTVASGDTLRGIASRLALSWQELGAANSLTEPYSLQPGQVLRLPGQRGGGGGPAAAGFVEILNPLQASGLTSVTSSSAQGHHTPYGGSRSADLALLGSSSQGVLAEFNVRAPSTMEVRGSVFMIANACASGRLSDGGNKVQIRIQTRTDGGGWVDSAAWVLYAHIDPVMVEFGQVLGPGSAIGRLGPASGGEYSSSCAQGSHVHVEAASASDVIDQDSQIGQMPVMKVAV